MFKTFLIGAAVAVSLMGSAQAANLTIGADAFADAGIDGTVAARFKDFSRRDAGKAGEMYLGEPDLGVPGNRNDVQNVAYTTNLVQNFTFGFNSSTNQLFSTIGSKSLTYDFTPTDIWNTVVIRFRNTGGDVNAQTLETNSFSLSNLFVNGEAVSDITMNAGFMNVSITDFAVLTDFQVTGTLNLKFDNGRYGKGEQSRFEILGANVSAVPVPAALPLLLTGLAALGLMSHRRTQKLAA